MARGVPLQAAVLVAARQGRLRLGLGAALLARPAHVKADQTKRVSNAYYAAGEFIFRQGDPGTNFYIIEKGDVEVIRSPDGMKPPEVVVVLGPGNFFGEMTLIQDVPRNASVRARTAVEVVVMGREVFSQVSGSLAPLRELLGQAVTRRSEELKQR